MRFTFAPLLLLSALATATIPPTTDPTNTTTTAPPSLHQYPTSPLFDISTLLPTADQPSISALGGTTHRCNTNSRSPPIASIHTLADVITHMPNKLCEQTLTPRGRANCKHHLGLGSAEFYVCGEKGKAIKCHSLAWAARHIVRMCGRNGRASGTYWFQEAGILALVA